MVVKTIGKKPNRFHERCLRTIYNDKQSSFNELLEKDGSVSIHEMYKNNLESWTKNMGSGTK